jgi:hypothetical protein
MTAPGYQPPKRAPTQRNHLERLVNQYGRSRGMAVARVRRRLSVVTLIGALDRVRGDDGPRFLVKGGISMELRLGIAARATRDVDVIFRGDTKELVDALDEAFAQPYSGFEFRRKTELEPIRETGSYRFYVQVSFRGKSWETLQLEVAPPEVAETELVRAAIDLADFSLDGPDRIACLSLRFQIAQKIHAVTERPTHRPNLRHWDLIDIILLRSLAPDDLADVHAACREIFESRATHAWPPTLDAVEIWREPYRADAERMGDAALPADVDSAARGGASVHRRDRACRLTRRDVARSVVVCDKPPVIAIPGCLARVVDGDRTRKVARCPTRRTRA